MNTVFVLLSLQAMMGAFDNLWHHELQARLPSRISARHELRLHAAREAIYGVVFIGLGWFEWRGAFALLLGGLLAIELFITLADFLEEDSTRKLPPLERVLHTLLTISYGLFLGFLAPVLAGWLALPTELALAAHGWVSWLFTIFGVSVLAWSVRNTLAVISLNSQAAGEGAETVATAAEPAWLRTQAAERAVLVTGATGFIGRALVPQLQQEGRRVIVLSRDARRARRIFGTDVWVVESLDVISSDTAIDAVVHLAGARVLGMPWTAARRRELLSSRVEITQALLGLMRRLARPPRVMVSASAVGYYGATPEPSAKPLDENGPPQPGRFQSDLCSAIEHEARRAEALQVRVVRMRFGVVFGRGDGAYPMLALGARLGLGAVLGSGRQCAPWVHLDDAVGLIRYALASDALSGPVNAVAPDTPSQARLAKSMAASFGRPQWLRLPGAPLRWAAGEMSSLLLDGQWVAPRAALAAGYAFRHPGLEEALADLAQRGRQG
ncbi:MAG: TIGR01777 family protein [Cupriavidus sp.]|nr:TIGR01777 family protein [Cupriavidus sp.]